MSRWIRMLRHLWFDASDARRALGDGTLRRLHERVSQSEARHTGEIRICVEGGMPMSYLWRNARPRERAVAMFSKLGVWNTEANNGVLVYLLVADRAIEIVADRGLARHVPASRWHEIVGGMRAAFQAGRFEEGLNAAIDAVTDHLVAHFPATPGAPNPNELPDEPDVR